MKKDLTKIAFNLVISVAPRGIRPPRSSHVFRLSMKCLGAAMILSRSTSFAQNASTPIYNFQFEGSGYYSTAPTDYSGTGALGYGGSTFNHIVLGLLSDPTVSLFNAVDSYGVASTVSLTVNCMYQMRWNSGPAGPNSPQTLLSQYLYSGGTPFVGTFTLANLPPNTAYKLDLYGGEGFTDSRGTLFNVVGGTADAGVQSTTAAQNTSFVEGVNYVIFTGTTSAEGAVFGTYQQTAGGTSIDPFNGLQINIASPIPEPAFTALGLLVSIAYAARLSLRRGAPVQKSTACRLHAS